MEYLNMLQTAQVILKIDHPAGKLKKKKSHLYRGKINQAKYSSLPLKGPGIVKAHDVNFP
jgi:hypothetical protein